VVAYRFPEATWVSYKLWSGIAFTVLLMIITTLLMSPWLKGESEENQTGSEI